MALNNVLDLAARQASWLVARENLVAQNVANANTPSYSTADLKPFEAEIQTASLRLATTSPRHISLAGNEFQPVAEDDAAGRGETFLSGNNVSLEAEMMKGGEITRSYALNVAVIKAFNSMLAQSAKG